MTGTEKIDALVLAGLFGAVGLSLADINAVLTALALGTGSVLAVLRIIRLLKHWDTPPNGK